MTLSVAPPPLIGDQVEVEALPEEVMDLEEMPSNNPEQGMLKSESKEYACTQMPTLTNPEKFESIRTTHLPKPKNIFETKPKNSAPLKEKQTLLQKKEFSQIHSKTSPGKSEKLPLPATVSKTEKTTHKTLEKAQAQPKTIKESSTPISLKGNQMFLKNAEHKIHKEFKRQESTKLTEKLEAKKNSLKQTENKPSSHTDSAKLAKQGLKEQQPIPQQQTEQKQKEEEEGFAEHQRQQEQSDEQEENQLSVGNITSPVAHEIVSYAAQESSILSQLFDMRVSQFDVLILFVEIMKLELKGREQERIGRQSEREMQIRHMQNVVDNYKDQGKWQLFSSIGSGVLSIVSGICPILGHVKGDFIIDKLGSVFSGLRDIDSHKFFKSITSITHAMSEMQKNTGQIQNTYAESNRSYDQHMSDLFRTDWEESTRTMEEIKDSWKGIENFIYQSLQMYHDAIRQLYN
ncbi:MAG: hypothetical protein S4CHLAM123_10100 [Chlamydiales bacterium]|nr:hypothetical protein [Chlamydiales bacterium]